MGVQKIMDKLEEFGFESKWSPSKKDLTIFIPYDQVVSVEGIGTSGERGTKMRLVLVDGEISFIYLPEEEAVRVKIVRGDKSYAVKVTQTERVETKFMPRGVAEVHLL